MALINNLVLGTGNTIGLNLTNSKHIAGSKGDETATAGLKPFGELVANAIDMVQVKQNDSNGLIEQMLVNPDSVSVHEISTAMAQAELSMRITKAIVDRGVRAYTDIVNMR